MYHYFRGVPSWQSLGRAPSGIGRDIRPSMARTISGQASQTPARPSLFCGPRLARRPAGIYDSPVNCAARRIVI
jgi:hypothetical protein